MPQHEYGVINQPDERGVFVAVEVGAAQGLYNDRHGALEAIPPPPPGVHPSATLTGKALAEGYGESIETILDAAAAEYITWEQAIAAAAHVGGYWLPTKVKTPTGNQYAVVQLVGWALCDVTDGFPPALNLLVRAAPVWYAGVAEGSHRLGNVEEVVLYDKARDVHVLVATDRCKAGQAPIAGDALQVAMDLFEAAADGLEDDA